MTLDELEEIDQASQMQTYGRFEAALVSGHGATAVDCNGTEYIDFGSGIGVNSLGYAHPDWVAAVQAQAAKLQHTSNLYYNETQTMLASELCKATEMGSVFFGNSGAEANECAIKLARKYSFDNYGSGRSTIVGLQNSFHGRTITTLSATGQDSFHQYFSPFTKGFAFADAGSMDSLLETIDDTTCAVMLECIQGEGGVVPISPSYLRAVRALCDERDLLLIIDEVQTGAGRTGMFFAYQHAGIMPDIVTMAKGLGGGLPIGACLCTEALADVLSVGLHGSTFGGNPVVCAGARVVVNKLTTPGFLENVEEKGTYLRARIEAMSNVKEVRGLGMMLGIVLNQGTAQEVAQDCLSHGLLVLTAKKLVRLLPPLTISREEMDKGLAVLEAALKGALDK